MKKVLALVIATLTALAGIASVAILGTFAEDVTEEAKAIEAVGVTLNDGVVLNVALKDAYTDSTVEFYAADGSLLGTGESCPLTSVKMSDNITIKVKNGDEVIQETVYSIKQYAEDAFATVDGKTKAMLRAMLAYGAASQNYFDYNVDALPNTTINRETSTPVIPEAYALDAVQGDKVTEASAALLLSDKISIVVYLKSEKNDLTVTVNGNAVETTIENGCQVLMIPVYPQDIDQMFTVEASDNTVIKYSAYTYIKNKLSSENQELVALIKAIYDYNQAANAYVQTECVASVTAEDGTVTLFNEIDKAYAAIQENSTLTLWDDVTTTEALALSVNAIIDLNGFNFAPSKINCDNAGVELLVKDNSSEKCGSLKTSVISNCTLTFLGGLLKYNQSASIAAGSTVNASEGAVVALPIYTGVEYVPYELRVGESLYMWSGAKITFDENGVGEGTAYPFRGTTALVVEDATTGKSKITYTALNSSTSTEYSAYIDVNTGIIVRAYKVGTSMTDVFYIVPTVNGTQNINNIKSCVLGSSRLIEYTVNNITNTAFTKDGVVYFNVTFTDINGKAVDIDKAATAPSVYIKDSTGTLLASYGFNGKEAVELDGIEGVYTSENNNLSLSGFGTLVLNGVNGVYSVASEEKDYTLDVYLVDETGKQTEYYQITLNGDKYTAVKPTVTVTFDCGDKATLKPLTLNVNIPVELPIPLNDNYTFKGWTINGVEIDNTFVPVSDVTITATWAGKVVINLVGVLGDDPTVLVLGEGDYVQNYLPVYTVDNATMRRFVCWYIDLDEDGTYSEDDCAITADSDALTIENSGLVLISHWEQLPLYTGSFVGSEIWYTSSNTDGKKITISEDGTISGVKTGTVLSYNPETQIGKWKKNTNSTEYVFIYDPITGMLVFPDSDGSELKSDHYVFFRTDVLEASGGKIPKVDSKNPNYGVYCYSPYNGTSTDYFAQFITTPTQKGEVETLLIYNNHVYSDITLKTAEGTVITAAYKIAAQTSIVVTDNKTGEIIFAVAGAKDKTIGQSTSSSNVTRPLDSYFGTYTGSKGDLTLNGVDTVILGSYSGSYTKADEGSTYTFDVYMTEGETTVYYRLTVNKTEKTYTIEKPCATINFVSAQATAPEAVLANINVAYALPILKSESYVFRGWYVQGDEEQKLVNLAYIPTENVTLVAKWDVMYTLKINYNNGEEPTVIKYGDGDIVNIELPQWSKHKFDGWFTSNGVESSEWGTEWNNGSAINADLTVYAKWSASPLYNQYYVTFEFESKTYKLESPSTAGIMYINPYGIGEGSGSTSYPHSYGFEVYKFLDETTVIIKSSNSSSTRYIRAKYDPITGMFAFRRTYVTTEESAANSQYNYDLLLMIPVGDEQYNKANISINKAVTWGNGNKKLIEVVYGENKYNVYLDVDTNEIYFNVTYKDMNGNAMTIEQALTASTLYIYDSENVCIGMFGYMNQNIVNLDGSQGVYTYEEGKTLELNGISTITIGANTGNYIAANEESDYDYDVYMTEGNKTVYYKLTIGENNTCTLVKPTVTITFVSDVENTTPDAVTVSPNVDYTLPELESDTHVFRGWYVLGDETQSLLKDTLVPTENITLEAKWDVKVTLTIVYGNGMETTISTFGAGDTISMNTFEPEIKDGKQFTHWYISEDGGVTEASEFTATTITENVTVYCAWKEIKYILTNNSTYQWTYDSTTDTWTSGNKGIGSSESTLTITAIYDMTITLDYTVSSETRWDWLYIKLGSNENVKQSGEVSNTFTLDMVAGDTLTITYKKDSSGNSGSDCATLNNFKVTLDGTEYIVTP